MKLSYKINLILIAMLMVMIVSMMVAGALIIGNQGYTLQDRVLSSELKKIRQTIVETLNQSGLRAAVQVATQLQADLKQSPQHVHLRSGKIFVLKKPDRVVYFQDHIRGQQIKWLHVEQLFQKKEGQFEYSYNGSAYYARYTTISPMDWLICLSISRKEMFAKRKEYLQRLSGIAIVILAISGLAVSLVVNHFVQRVRTTLACVKLIEQGNLDTRIEPINSSDEMGDLQAGVNAMSAKIKQRTIERQKAESVMNRYEHIISSTHDLMSFLDRSYTYLAVNNAYLKAYDKKREEIVGFTVENLIGTKKFHKLAKPYLDRALSGEKIEYQAWFDYAGIGRRFMDVNYYPFRDAHGQDIDGVVVAVHDLTERRHAEMELQEHRDQLEEQVKARTAALAAAKEQAVAANVAKSNFLANMSHELRTPLNAILGYAQILQNRSLDPDLAKGLTTIQQSGEHLLTLINDILDTAKIETGKAELSPELIHLDTFLETIMAIIRTPAESKGLEIKLERPASMPNGVLLDGVRLRQVLLNLLNNAVKFTDSGEVVLRLRWENSNENADKVRLLFGVIDTGIGISSDHLERIFSPFEQALDDLGRQSGGSGLGLFISRHLVSLMGGELTVDSDPGRGSTFSFSLEVPTSEEIPEREALDNRGIAGYMGPQRRVLVVDDTDSNRMVLAGLLQPLGFDVVEAAGGIQAIAAAQENPPDLILMDRYMPEMDGLAAIVELRRIEELQHIPIIAVSASVAEEDQRKLLEAGFDDFMAKPVLWSSLEKLLKSHLDLQWHYTEEKVSSNEDVNENKTVIPPSIEELRILKHLAMVGDMEAILSQADQIELLGEKYTPFARKLRELADSFDDQQIQKLLHQYAEGQS